MHVDFMREKNGAMPTPAEPDKVGSAKFWDCAYATFEPLKHLTKLHTLEILSFPDPTLEVLAVLPRLRYLRIIHLPKVESLEPLASLLELETLGLETLPSWDSSGRVTEVRSLSPLAQLRSLRHLQLFGVRTSDRSLSPLESCPALESARFSKYPKKEVERFYAATGVADSFIPQPVFDAG